MSTINESLLELFQSHEVDCTLDGEWIRFPNSPIRASTWVAGEKHGPGGTYIQLNVQIEIVPGRSLVESFAGIGETKDAAVADGFLNFVINAFHVLLTAFFKPDDDQTDHNMWTFSGRTRRVTIGSVGIRGILPVDPDHLVESVEQIDRKQIVGCFEQMQHKIKEVALGPETHWIRLYYAQAQGERAASEILLDNEVLEDQQRELEAFDWPRREGFYGARVFLIVHAEEDLNTPECAVVRLADTFAVAPELSDVEVFQRLAEDGIPLANAERAFKFAQMAWGRVLLADTGIGYSDEYLGFDSEGHVRERGPLSEERCFATAMQIASSYLRTPAFPRLALSSAEVDVVNKALQSGMKREKLAEANLSAFVFLEEPTESGYQAAQKVIDAYQSPRQRQSTPENSAQQIPGSKPWWKFWGQ